MGYGWVRNCKERVMLLFKELYLSLVERLDYRIVKNVRIAVAWSVFERVTARKEVYLLLCSPSGCCRRRHVWSLRRSHVAILLFGGYI
jgi:hypothetical protein